MTNHNSLADLIKQLRRDKIATQWLPKLRYSHLCLKPYTRNKEEAALLAGILEKRIANVDILERLKGRLVNEDIPNTNNLAEFAMKLYRVYSRYAANEPGGSRQFNRILPLLRLIIEVANANRQQERELQKKLELMLSGHPGVEKLPAFYNEDVDRLVDLRERYSDILQRNYDAFNDILRDESDEKPGIKLTSRVQEDLLKMTSIMEQAIFHSESTKLELVKWQKRLVRLEKQEQLN